MSRIACIRVPGFPLAALQRSEPELRGRTVAVAERDEAQAPLVAVSAEASARGIRKGFSVTQARALSSSLEIRTVPAGILHAAGEALVDVAASFSPRFEDVGSGVLFLDVDGLSNLFESETHLATILAGRCRQVGLGAKVGLASTKIAALLAARSTRTLTSVPPDEERKRLSPLPLALLDPSPELTLRLRRWGLRTLGDLARLPGKEIASRLGEEGIRLRRRALGEDERELAPTRPPTRFEELLDCEYGIDRFEPLSFLLRGALERLTARLRVRGFRAGDLHLALILEGGGRERRTVGIAAPTNDVKTLLSFLRRSFETRSPGGPVEEILLRVTPERTGPVELDLFAPAGPAPEELGAAIARIAALTGPDRVGRAVPADSYRPGAFEVERFTSSPNPLPLDEGERVSCASLALRAFRPPVSLDVVCDRDRPDFVRKPASDTGGRTRDPISGRVVTRAGPWRLYGEWWCRDPLARDEWDVELTDGCVYRIFRRHRDDRWFAEGVYD